MSLEDLHVEPPGPPSITNRYGRKRPATGGVSALTASLLVLVAGALGAAGSYNFIRKTSDHSIEQIMELQQAAIKKNNEALIKAVKEANKEHADTLNITVVKALEEVGTENRAALLEAVLEAVRENNAQAIQSVLKAQSEHIIGGVEQRIDTALQQLGERQEQYEKDQEESREAQKTAEVEKAVADISAALKDLLAVAERFQQVRKSVSRDDIEGYGQLERFVEEHGIEEFIQFADSRVVAGERDAKSVLPELDHESAIKTQVFYNRLKSMEKLLSGINNTRTETELVEQVHANKVTRKEGYIIENISLLYSILLERNQVTNRIMDQLLDAVRAGADALLILDNERVEQGEASLLEQEYSTFAGIMGMVEDLSSRTDEVSIYPENIITLVESIKKQFY